MTATISSLIEFLMALLGDEELQADFRADPEGVLDQYGLDVTCGENIRNAGPMVADQVGVHGTGHPHFAGGDDPATEISVLPRHYDVTTGPTTNEYNVYYVDDHDTVNIHSEGDLTAALRSSVAAAAASRAPSQSRFACRRPVAAARTDAGSTSAIWSQHVAASASQGASMAWSASAVACAP